MTLDDERCLWMEMAMLCEGELDVCPCGCSHKTLPAPWRYDGHSPGLCSLVESINPKCARRLLAHAIREQGLYWWPRDRSGWDARARFCWARALDCEREMNEAEQ